MGQILFVARYCMFSECLLLDWLLSDECFKLVIWAVAPDNVMIVWLDFRLCRSELDISDITKNL